MSGGREGDGTTPFALKYRLQGGRRPFTGEQVRMLPKERCGVYALWLPSAEPAGAWDCLYVGKSESCVRRRLLEHLGEEPNPRLRQALRTFGGLVEWSIAFTAGPEETDALETSVIRDWQPDANRNKL